jgi:hypothetical protein
MEERIRNLKNSILCRNFKRKDMSLSSDPSGREYWFFLVCEFACEKSNRSLAEDFPGNKSVHFADKFLVKKTLMGLSAK